jgi:glycosyltransferase 2 family protein
MLKYCIQLSLSGLLVLYLCFKVDWAVIIESLHRINILAYLLSTVMASVCPVILASKFHVFIKNTHLSLSIPRLVAINFISRYYALFIPTALGAEAVRWYKVTKNKKGKSFFLASTIFERLIFLLLLLAFGGLPLFLNSENPQIVLLRQRITPLLAISLLFLSTGFIFFLFPELKDRFTRALIGRFPALEDSKIERFLINFKIKQRVQAVIIPLLALSLLWQIFFVVRIYFLFLSLNLPLGFMDAAWIGSLVMLLQVLPVSFAGIGIREGAYAYLFTLFELAPEKGVLIGVLFFSQMLIFAFIGAVLNLFEK